MRPTRTATQVLMDMDSPSDYEDYKADSWDVDAYLKEISGDGFEAQRDAIMESYRDRLCDPKLSVSFILSAIGDNPTSPASLDMFAITHQGIRSDAAKQLEMEVYTEAERREHYDSTEDYERDMVDEFGGAL